MFILVSFDGGVIFMVSRKPKEKGNVNHVCLGMQRRQINSHRLIILNKVIALYYYCSITKSLYDTFKFNRQYLMNILI